MSENDFDVVVLGTGLTESIVAAAIAKAGLRVLHLDESPYYGDRDASLSAIELHHLVMQPKAFMENVSAPVPIPEAVLRESRNYSFSLSPSISPSIGPFIDTLVKSGVARYVPFKLLDAVGLYSDTAERSSQVRLVPASKEDVFKSKELGLPQKRKLMKFLMGANSSERHPAPTQEGGESSPTKTTFRDYLQSKEVGLDAGIADAIAYALALSTDANEEKDSAITRLQKYIRSTGRHGNSPFIVGHFGGAGELAQGFCRACAVAGGTYILGRPFTINRIDAIESHSSADASSSSPIHSFQIKIDDVEEPLRARVVVGAQERLHGLSLQTNLQPENIGETVLARCIAVLDAPVRFRPSTSPQKVPTEDFEKDGGESAEALLGDIDTAVLVFPPGSLADSREQIGVVHALIAGIVYLSATINRHSSAEETLQPYLAAIRDMNRGEDEPSKLNCSLFYTETVASKSESEPRYGPPEEPQNFLVPVERPNSHLAEFGDSVAVEAENVFWVVMKSLGLDGRASMGKQKESPGSDYAGQEQELVIVMWPSLVDEGVEE
ncbi:hypothetical protein PIIN_00803 [Serendipita indica DSM 11827]|uniref:Rab proteins geranylgeranyltransferase component A n=1 Tax=Serendipita indica (strain DSM 11827) TaxID=1109443 RepID=G4T6M3_SERID|nr:hypothetical protein PIIN_00803 [Serendipita indica DSM 11827]